MWILKLDSAGDVIWNSTLGGSGWDVAYGAVPLPDGGCVTYGESLSNDGDFPENLQSLDAWAIRLDPQGKVIWKKRFGGDGKDTFLDGAFFQDKIALTGEFRSYDAYHANPTSDSGLSYWLVVLDMNGDVVVDQFYGGWSQDLSNQIEATTDRLFIGGTSKSYIALDHPDVGDVYPPKLKSSWGEYKDWWIIELDSSFQIVGSTVYGGNRAEKVFSLSAWNNEVTVAGETSSFDGDVKGAITSPSTWFVTFKSSIGMSGIVETSLNPNAIVNYESENHSISIQSLSMSIRADHFFFVNTKGELLQCTFDQVSTNQVRAFLNDEYSGPYFLVYEPNHMMQQVYKVYVPH